MELKTPYLKWPIILKFTVFLTHRKMCPVRFPCFQRPFFKQAQTNLNLMSYYNYGDSTVMSNNLPIMLASSVKAHSPAAKRDGDTMAADVLEIWEEINPQYLAELHFKAFSQLCNIEVKMSQTTKRNIIVMTIKNISTSFTI